VAQHPSGRRHGGYHEIQNPQLRWALIKLRVKGRKARKGVDNMNGQPGRARRGIGEYGP